MPSSRGRFCLGCRSIPPNRHDLGMAKQTENREERRRKQFGGHRPTTETNWPASAPNPVFGDADAPKDALAGGGDQDEKAATGAGTGGATESDGRIVRHQGTHATNTQKQ